MVAGRVSHACQACAKARVKCEETKPCSRCRTRSLVCRPPASVFPRQHPPPLVFPYSPAYAGQQSPPMDAGNMPAISDVADPAVASQSAYPVQFALSDVNSAGVARQMLMPFHSSGYDAHVAALDHVSIASTPVTNTAPVATIANTSSDTHGGHGMTPSMGYYHAHNVSAISLGHPTTPGFGIQPDLISSQGSVGDDVVRIESGGYTACMEGIGHRNLDFDDSSSALPGVRHYSTNSEWQTNPLTSLHRGGTLEDMREVWRVYDNHNGQSSTITGQPTGLPTSIGSGELIVDASHIFPERLTPALRDRMLAVILQTSPTAPSETMRVASLFPPVDVLGDLIHVFLASHTGRPYQWIDLGTSFTLSSQHPKWLVSAAVAGAAFVADSSVQQFRQVFEEPIRVTVSAIPAQTRAALGANGTDQKTNNSDVELMLLQAMVLFQDIGLWNSEYTVMEITQGYLNTPIAVIRSRGLFQRSVYPTVAIHFSESEVELERKRSRWMEQESWKRLVFHCYLRDAQVSIAWQIPPQISTVELTLPLPESRSVWQARHTHEWASRYMEGTTTRHGIPRRQLPNVADLFRDVSLLTTFREMLDVPFATSIYLHGFWSIIWQLQQLNAVRQPRGGLADLDKAYGSMTIFPTQSENQPNYLLYSPYSPYMSTSPQGPLRWSPGRPGTTVTSGSSPGAFPSLPKSQRQELVEQLQQFRAVLHGWYEISAQEELMLNLLELHLHISLYDLELFSEREHKVANDGYGVDGDGCDAESALGRAVIGDARDQIRVSSRSQYAGIDQRLQEWSSGINGRQAAWHAGQILSRFRQGIPADHERTFYAVALQQAALVLWAWGTSQQAAALGVNRTGPSGNTDESRCAYVFVDGAECPAVQQFVRFGQGEPVIRNATAGCASSSGLATTTLARLNEPRACMDVVLSELRATYGTGQEIDRAVNMPSLVKNLYRRIEQLGAAASAVGLGIA